MIKSSFFKIVYLALIGLAGSCPTSQAQSPFNDPLGQYNRRPTVSPYHNLLRLGPKYSDYFNLTRQQFATQRAFQRLGQDDHPLPKAGATIRPTGLRARFFNYSHYYRIERPKGTPGSRYSGP